MALKGRPGGIRASDLQAPSPNCLVVHPLDLSKIPKSKIQNPKSPKSPKSKIPKIPKIQNPQNPKSKIPKIPKSKIQNPQNPKSKNPKIPKIQNPQNPKSPKSKIQTFLARFWGFWILDFGSLCSNSLREAPNAPNFGFGGGFWILDFGDFGDFGFWGSWILDFGLGILDGHLVTKFWMLHKKRRLCTPNRVGGLRLSYSDIVCIHRYFLFHMISFRYYIFLFITLCK